MPFDILLDENFDLLFKDGDLVIGESTRQHQQLLLLTQKGENREFPTTGVGLKNWTLDENPGDLNGEIKKEFEKDGMKVLQVKTTSNLSNMHLEAVYE